MFGSLMAGHQDESTNKRKHADYEQHRYEGVVGRVGNDGNSSGNEVCGRGYPREDTPPAQCSVLCGPRSCSTLPSSMGSQNDCGTSPPEPKRRRMWGLRGLVKMFRRRVRRKGGADSSESPQPPPPTVRARSASELTVDTSNRNSGGGPYNQGLSVSHDSVFSPESPTEQTHTAPSGLALATRGVNMSELKEALRRRRTTDSASVDDDFDDPGLPRSPQTSPTTLDVLNHGLKSSSRGAQSSCSDGSLLSMGSSENDEDSFGVLSRHSSKHSLIQVVDHEPAVGAAPLSHKAARHKISVRPKRTHGIPRAKKQTQALSSSLPATPEVNEDSNLRNEKLDLSSSSAPSPSAYTQPVSNQRPTSISFSSSSEAHFVRRVDRSDCRRAERKSLPNPPSLTQEERKEEPFLSRLFGSVKSNQSQQESYQVINENIPSDGGRLSREKRKDQFRPPTGSKTGRQKSDPSRITYTEETTIEKCSSHRSSSVEGRLEGNPLYTEDCSFMQESIPPPLEFEIGNELPLRGFDETPTSSRTGVAPNRLSSSFDNLSDDNILPTSLSSQNQIGLSTESCEGRSSTDSLTTTPLPGIYIRSNQSLNKVRKTSGLNQAKESLSRFREEQLRNQMNIDTTTGPLSLDSSLNLVQHVGEEFRKTISTNEVPFCKVTADNLIDNSMVSSPRSASVMRSVSVNSPASSSRASSIRSRKSSIGDELESDSSLSKVALRKVKRESSFKNQEEEEEEKKVPEFLRIQLNRVQNKGGSVVVFGTEKKSVNSTNKSTIVNVREWTDVSQRDDRNIVVNVETEKPRDHSEIIIVEEKNLIEVNNQRKIEEKRTTSPQTIHQLSNTPPFSGKGFSKRKSNEEPCHKDEEIVLRRPSVVDRAIVIDQTMGALPSPIVKGSDEPELFKVFARRSFKLKDPEMESSLEGEPNDVDKENHLPVSTYDETFVNQQRKSERHSVIPTFSSGPVIKPSVPVLKNVISNRYSCGNVNIGSSHNLEFKPPSVLSSNVISSGEDSDPKTISSQWDTSVFKGRVNETGITITGSKSHQVYPSPPLFKKCSIQESSASKFHISEKNIEVSVVQDNMNQKVAKQGFYNINQKNNQVKSFDKYSNTKINEKESPPYFENVRRSSSLSQSEVSDISSIETEQNAKVPKGQAVFWPPRHQLPEQLLLLESDTSSHSRSSLPSCTPPSRTSIALSTQQGRASLPKSKILNSFKEQHSPNLSDDVESHSSGSTEEIPSGRSTISIDSRRKSLKETTTTSNSILAEARNTSFTHSFDNHSSPLALSYLGRGESSLKLSRKGSVDESLKSSTVVEDWRVLAKQRREDRMKQTKTPDTKEIIIETRPSVSRSSKVLEMANNFQKLQVA